MKGKMKKYNMAKLPKEKEIKWKPLKIESLEDLLALDKRKFMLKKGELLEEIEEIDGLRYVTYYRGLL